MAVGYGMVDSAYTNVVAALVVSYVVLVVVTRNLLVPIIAILSIGSTICWVIAGVILCGYEFEFFAAILTVMIVGMSVDYAVHLTRGLLCSNCNANSAVLTVVSVRVADFYNEAPGATRYEKAQSALHGVGISVVGGAVTTAGAAIPLAASQHFIFFKEAGLFILFVAIFGVIFSFTLLIPLFMICGPEGETGDLAALFRRLRGKPATDASKASEDGSCA